LVFNDDPTFNWITIYEASGGVGKPQGDKQPIKESFDVLLLDLLIQILRKV